MKRILEHKFSLLHVILLGVLIGCIMKVPLPDLISRESSPPTLLRIEPTVTPTYNPLGIIALQEGEVPVLYRLSDGWVLNISVKGNIFQNADGRYFAVSTNNNFLDGKDETITKILIPGTPNVIRNATALEIVDFQAEDIEQGKQEELDGVNNRIENSPQFRKFVKALTKMLVKEFNRSRVLDGVTPLTNTQALTALKNELNKND